MSNHMTYFYIQYSELINLFNSNIEIINIIYITLPNFPKYKITSCTYRGHILHILLFTGHVLSYWPKIQIQNL